MIYQLRSLSIVQLFSLSLLLLTHIPLSRASDWIQYPSNGIATMTHYTLPLGFIAACGCSLISTYYPTAAMSQMAYGSSTAYGPACGLCFNLTLLNTFTSTPPFYPNVTSSVVVKITDLCPLYDDDWCSATTSQPNAGGAYVNFDLSWPSPSIPDSFFPSDAALYGYTDFGVWNISYQSVSCELWEGWDNSTALGTVTGYTACCPDDPTLGTNDTCPSFSDLNGISPTDSPAASSSDALTLAMPRLLPLFALALLFVCLFLSQ